jgi:hypothetical protein
VSHATPRAARTAASVCVCGKHRTPQKRSARSPTQGNASDTHTNATAPTIRQQYATPHTNKHKNNTTRTATIRQQYANATSRHAGTFKNLGERSGAREKARSVCVSPQPQVLPQGRHADSQQKVQPRHLAALVQAMRGLRHMRAQPQPLRMQGMQGCGQDQFPLRAQCIQVPLRTVRHQQMPAREQ